MTRIKYKCELLSDIVLNASLNTEGNMETLDYIPGSNFLGIVAKEIYANHAALAYDMLHSDKIIFGNAYVGIADQKTHPIPFSYLQDKLYSNLESDPIYIDFNVNHKAGILVNGNKRQLKQVRGGFMTNDYRYIDKIERSFALKSAQDTDIRRSKEGAMFGFESINKGYTFIFHIDYTHNDDISIIEEYLCGYKSIGKSKSAEFGQVMITSLGEDVKQESSEEVKIVYADSNLCFYDQQGQPTLMPSAKDLGLLDGEINWSKSQIRTYSYSPWNAKRNTTSTQRFVILKGSVFYIENGKFDGSIAWPVGEYINEGLGQVIYNPIFLPLDQETMENKLIKVEFKSGKIEKPKGSLNNFLQKIKNYDDDLIKIIQSVNQILREDYREFKHITASQWGLIKATATNYDYEKSMSMLYERDKGILYNGVAYEKYWSKDDEAPLNKLKELIESEGNKSSIFIAKLAEELAKKSKDN